MYIRRRPPTWKAIERLCWQCLVARDLAATATFNSTRASGRRFFSDATTAPAEEPELQTKRNPNRKKNDKAWVRGGSNDGGMGDRPPSSKSQVLNLRDKFVKSQKLAVRQREAEFVPLDEISLDQRLNDILEAERIDNQDINLLDIITTYKPENARVSEDRMEQLRRELERSFKLDNLRNYVRENSTEPLKLQGLKKSNLVDVILNKLWKIEAGEDIDPASDVVQRKIMESDRVKLFFIIGDGGSRIRDLANLHRTKITVQLATKSLELSGVAKDIEGCEKAMRSIIGNIISDDFDVTPILRVARFDGSLIGPISRATGTFMEKIDEKTLRIYTAGPKRNKLDDAKRLLLNTFELIGEHTKYSLLCETATKDTEKAALFTVTENRSLPLRFRASHWSRWRTVRKRPGETSVHSVADALKLAGSNQNESATSQTTEAPAAQVESGVTAQSSKDDNSPAGDSANETAVEEVKKKVTSNEVAEVVSSNIDTSSDAEKPVAQNDEETPESPFQQLSAGDYASSVQPPTETTATKTLEKNPTSDSYGTFLSDATALKTFLDHESVRKESQHASGLQTEVEYHSYLGHIVHSAPATSSREFVNLPALMKGNHSRLFLNTVPHLSDAMTRLKPYRISTSFNLRFSPSPWAQADNFETLPKLRLKLDTNPVNGELFNPVFSATLHETVADILLPDKAADIRFVRMEVLPLDASAPAVQEYIAASELNPLKNSRFTTPPSIKIDLPRQLVQGTSSTTEANEKSETVEAKEESETIKTNEESETVEAAEQENEKAEEPSPTIPVEYFFTGMEHHSSFFYRWAGQDLVYSKIEGGAAGARYQEVRLLYNPPNSQVPPWTPQVEGQAERENEWWIPSAENDVENDLFRKDKKKTKKSHGPGKAGPNPERWNRDEFLRLGAEYDYDAAAGGAKLVDGAEGERELDAEEAQKRAFTKFVTATRRVLSLVEKSTSRSVL